MEACMICLQPQSEWSKEHLVGDALGGNYILGEGVCLECNTLMSNAFEDRFFKSYPCVTFKALNNIKGRRERELKLFPGVGINTSNGKKVRVDNNGQPHYVEDDITITKNHNGEINIEGRVDINSGKDSAASITRKAIRKYPELKNKEDEILSAVQEKLDNGVIEQESIQAQYNVEYDAGTALLAICKSVYELLYSTYGKQILTIASMDKIREALHRGDYRILPKEVALTQKPDFVTDDLLGKNSHLILHSDRLWLAYIANIWVIGAYTPKKESIYFIQTKLHYFPYDGRAYSVLSL